MKNFLKEENEHGVLVLNPGQCHDTVWVPLPFNVTSGWLGILTGGLLWNFLWQRFILGWSFDKGTVVIITSKCNAMWYLSLNHWWTGAQVIGWGNCSCYKGLQKAYKVIWFITIKVNNSMLYHRCLRQGDLCISIPLEVYWE